MSVPSKCYALDGLHRKALTRYVKKLWLLDCGNKKIPNVFRQLSLQSGFLLVQMALATQHPAISSFYFKTALKMKDGPHPATVWVQPLWGVY